MNTNWHSVKQTKPDEICVLLENGDHVLMDLKNAEELAVKIRSMVRAQQRKDSPKEASAFESFVASRVGFVVHPPQAKKLHKDSNLLVMSQFPTICTIDEGGEHHYWGATNKFMLKLWDELVALTEDFMMDAISKGEKDAN